MAKPSTTGTTHTLPFDRLSPRDFERLCLWLVEREGYERAENLGAAGNDQGRDIIAWRYGQLWAFQCKRVQTFGPTDALNEVEKVLALPDGQRPVGLIFLVTCNVSATTRHEAQKRCAGEMKCHFWAQTELDGKVKSYPEILSEFFQDVATDSPIFFSDGSVVYKPEGLTISQIRELFEIYRAIERNVSPDYLSPKELDDTLKRFYQHHERLYEWKELHNSLEGILRAFDAFDAHVRDCSRKRQLPQWIELRNLWYPVSNGVYALLSWAEDIQYIGERYQVQQDGKMYGPVWATHLSRLCQDINGHLGIKHSENPQADTGSTLTPSGYPGATNRLLFRWLLLEPQWWHDFRKLMQDFDHHTKQQMTRANNGLRDEARAIYELSRRVFGAKNR